uniref:Uncharacterized protein n=1 Tax=Rhipicephalus microplus TaxID=6941 RepID=A0A6G5A0A0_RHIMP
MVNNLATMGSLLGFSFALRMKTWVAESQSEILDFKVFFSLFWPHYTGLYGQSTIANFKTCFILPLIGCTLPLFLYLIPTAATQAL